MASFSSLSDLDIEKQVATLTRQLNDLKKVLARRGDAYYEDGREAASDYYSQLYDRLRRGAACNKAQGQGD
ncbi:hypothetical protein ACVOMV_35205 [Mesorhizobium atlanticum]